MGVFGSAAGGAIGSVAGRILGGMLPFATGGRVPGKKGAPRKILAHGGEYVLPAGVEPTKTQKEAVAKNKREKKSKLATKRGFKALTKL